MMHDGSGSDRTPDSLFFSVWDQKAWNEYNQSSLNSLPATLVEIPRNCLGLPAFL